VKITDNGINIEVICEYGQHDRVEDVARGIQYISWKMIMGAKLVSVLRPEGRFEFKLISEVRR